MSRPPIWNWKAAVLSATLRAPVFLLVNLQAGRWAALAAFQTELVYRLVASGFYGAFTEYCATLRPERVGTIAALVGVPAVAHSAEFAVHRLAGTANVTGSILASIVVSMVTTNVMLTFMRRGLLLSASSSSLGADLARVWGPVRVHALRRLADRLHGRSL